MEIEKILSGLSLEEKISFCTGANFWQTKTLPNFGVPAMMMSDGPHGLRCQKGETDMVGINNSLPATCFPTAVTAGATWNPALYADEGAAIGSEALAADVSMVLGPGCNIKRNPLNGRNFEYLSEDPYLSGKMAAAFIQGQQSTGASSCIKHFAANSQEYKRMNGDSQMDERTLREIYLKGFEIAVKEGRPNAVMCAYNKINGVHCSDSKELLTNILRNEWGFSGAVVTDWGAMNDRVEGFRAGCDLNMPGGSQFMERTVAEAVRSGQLQESDIDACVTRILKLVEHGQNAQSTRVDSDSHHALARRIAEQGAVLLKNDDDLLPLHPEEFAFFGHMASAPRYQGSGSSHINPTKLTSLIDQLPEVAYVPCCNAAGEVNEQSLAEAQQEASRHKAAVVVAGLTDAYESEAFDREHMGLPDGHNRMIEAVAQSNPNTVVVLLGGSPMELPWIDKVKAVLYMGLPGQAGAEAIANLLTGKATPCGKLTESWPVSYNDVASKDTFGQINPEYREGIYVGYRYYDKANMPVRYPFGYGLSYTTFAYDEIKIDKGRVSVHVTNTGDVAGAEVVQLYVAPPQTGLFRPIKELAGFERLELNPGESKEAVFELDERSFALWDDGWKTPGGSYTLMVGASSQDIRLQGVIEIDGEAVPAPAWQAWSWYEAPTGTPPREDWEQLMGRQVPVLAEPQKGSFTLDNSCMEMKDKSLLMKIQYKVTELIIAKGFGGKKDMSNPAFRMMIVAATDCPMRAVVINSGGAMKDSLAQGLVHMANGHWLKGLRSILGMAEKTKG